MSKSTKALAILGVVAGLGVAALPLSSYAATEGQHYYNQDEMTVNLNVNDFISLETTQANKTVSLGNVINNGPIVSGTGTINVKTNNAGGYVVKISPKDGTKTGMVGKTASNTETIAAGVPKVGESKWGYRLAAAEGGTADAYQGLTAEAELTKTTAKPADAGDTITIEFGASVSASQAADEYSTTVLLTATTAATTDVVELPSTPTEG